MIRGLGTQVQCIAIRVDFGGFGQQRQAAAQTILTVGHAPLAESAGSGMMETVRFIGVLCGPTRRSREKQVRQQYGRQKVAANSTNLASKNRAGMQLWADLEARR
jgi:hypothetical protein